MSNQQLAIKIENLSKKYILHHQKPTLVENILKLGVKEEIWALKDINLAIKKKERLGVIGPNGSGKTTLLKIITGITSPTEGKVKVIGKIASLIDLAAGFHPELTGEENTYLNGMLLGMSKAEVRRKFDQIVTFSGLAKFIDTPFYTYSSGMALRLGFAIAIHSDPDILLIDEILSVGDQEFQKKSFAAMQDFFKRGKTMIFISHNPLVVAKVCPTCIWLDKGRLRKRGKSRKIIEAYIGR